MKTLLFLSVILMAFLSFNCTSLKEKKESNSVKIFYYVNENKCSKQNIESYLLSSGYFKSSGKNGKTNIFQSLYSLGTEIMVNTYDDNSGFLFVSENSSIFKMLINNGRFIETSTDHSGYTWMTYSYDNTKYMLRKEEALDLNNKIFYAYAIRGICN